MTASAELASCPASRSLPPAAATAAAVPSAYPSFQPSPVARAMASASSAYAPASSTRPVCRAISLTRLSADASQKGSRADRHSSSPSRATGSAAAGSLDRISCARPTSAGPRRESATFAMRRNPSSQSPPSVKVPRTSQHGRTAVHSRSPDSASPSARHWFSTCVMLPLSTSYLRNTSTRADHGPGTCAMPSAAFCSASRTE